MKMLCFKYLNPSFFNSKSIFLLITISIDKVTEDVNNHFPILSDGFALNREASGGKI